RYDKGGEDYINCPLDRGQYHAFVEAVVSAEKVPTRDFERCIYFEGCMPIEEMARRGRDTLAFGPMRPVGLVDPRSGGRPHACVQLRQDDVEGRLFNMVGFQTKMTYPEQRRVFRMIPGLGLAEFVRLGSLHRNTFVDAPALLLPSLQVMGRKRLLLAGKLVGVDGYVESAATGLQAGLNAGRLFVGHAPHAPPRATALGSLLAYVTQRGKKGFQPMIAYYGLFPPLARARRRAGRLRGALAMTAGELARAIAAMLVRDTVPVAEAARAVVGWLARAPADEVAVGLAVAADPAAALHQLARLLPAAEAPPAPGRVAPLLRLLGGSPALAGSLVAEGAAWPALVAAVLEVPARGPDVQRAGLAAAGGSGRLSRAELQAALRRHRRRELVRIGGRDLLGLASVEDTVRELSALAEGVIDAAVASV